MSKPVIFDMGRSQVRPVEVIFDMGRSQVRPVEWFKPIKDSLTTVKLLKAIQEIADHSARLTRLR